MTAPRKPQDHMTAVKAEALDAPLSFDYDGITYTIPPAAEWDVDALEAYEDERTIGFLRGVLGPEQWSAFKAKGRKASDLEGLTNAMLEAAGQGN